MKFLRSFDFQKPFAGTLYYKILPRLEIPKRGCTGVNSDVRKMSRRERERENEESEKSVKPFCCLWIILLPLKNLLKKFRRPKKYKIF